MGCITSTKNDRLDVFRIRAAYLLTDPPTILNGYLDLTTRELTFITPGREPIVWALHHLRRYGLTDDLFTFEAGRRCMSGQGIYAFHCEEADLFYSLFQRYINAVNAEAFTLSDREHLSSITTVVTAPDPIPQINNYLEPVTALQCSNAGRCMVATLNGNLNRAALGSGFDFTASNSSRIPYIGSPDSLPCISFNNGVVHFQHLGNRNQFHSQSPLTPGAYINTDMYFDQPMSTLQEHNNNATSSPLINASSNAILLNAFSGYCSAFSTMRRRPLLNGYSLDVPPHETAPSINTKNDDELHWYSNIDMPGRLSLRERLCYGSDEHCYENVNRVDLPLLLQPPPQKNSVNYIVLDLDPPRSPVQTSPKAHKDGNFYLEPVTPAPTVQPHTFNIPIIITTDDTDTEMQVDLPVESTVVASASAPAEAVAIATAPETTEAKSTIEAEATAGETATATEATSTSTSVATPSAKTTDPRTVTVTPKTRAAKKKTETPLSYSTIDFVKTCALIKSTTHTSDFDRSSEHNPDEIRITRHSKCVRKSFSISE